MYNRYTIFNALFASMAGRAYECKLISCGGVGSTALGRHLWSTNDKTPYEHAFSPELFKSKPRLRLGYMYGDPYNAVLSVFRRGYQQMHSRAMHTGTGQPTPDLTGVTLDQYLEAGVDQFGLEAQFDRWTRAVTPACDTILIKYEDLSENINQVLEFFSVQKPFQVRTRKTSWDSQPSHIQAGLHRIYGPLREKVLAMPGIKIREA
jgi:hypothetical protein